MKFAIYDVRLMSQIPSDRVMFVYSIAKKLGRPEEEVFRYLKASNWHASNAEDAMRADGLLKPIPVTERSYVDFLAESLRPRQ